MKKSLLLLVPFMMLAGCAINGLNPFGGDEEFGGSGLATLAIQIIEPSKGSIDFDELNVVSASFRIIDSTAVTQNTNWVPGSAIRINFNPIKPGNTQLRLIDVDVVGTAATNSTNLLVRGGYNYVFRVSLGGLIYMIETNATAAAVSNYMAVYSETHAVPTLNNVFNPLNGANLFIWTPKTILTEVTTGSFEGTRNWQITREATNVTTAWVGFGITSTNGVKDKSIYSGGHLKFAIKNAIPGNTYKVGIISVTGTVTNDRFVDVATIPGYAADGNWKYLSVPMSDFTGINFSAISCYFYIASTAQTIAALSMSLDDIYWSRD